MPILTAKLGDSRSIFPDILSIYVKEKTKVLDMTYGIGTFWKNVDVSKYNLYANDKDKDRGDYHYDLRSTGFPSKFFNTVIFDPPFANRSSNKTGFAASIYNNGKEQLNTIKEMEELYMDGILEANRLLNKNGILIIKCMDEISGGKQYRNHIKIWNMALDNGFIDEDLFILVQTRIPVMRHKKQVHARKNNSFFWIFRKK